MPNFFGQFSKPSNVTKFKEDPARFMSETRINTFYITPPDIAKSQIQDKKVHSFLLEPGMNGEVLLQMDLKQQNRKKDVIAAYYLPYNPNVKSKFDIDSILIPKQSPDSNFVFTGALTGCTVIVEVEGDNFRVYHEPRAYEDDDSTEEKGCKSEYKNVVAVFGRDQMYTDKSSKGTAGSVVIAYDKHTSKWSLLSQNLKLSESAEKSSIVSVEFSQQKPCLEGIEIPTKAEPMEDLVFFNQQLDSVREAVIHENLNKSLEMV
ncbi:hypothetical protein PsalMR5_04811 (plasmid) [Piscirickettsia salmonis]|nr:hypothetical protein PsalBI1_04782 [Piscirickettsia salmonis]QGP66886.1 hypothetical protein PsalMR5_04811 [Piscirickettsia salmonis]